MTKKPKEKKQVEWWLAELNQYGYCGNGDLKDGPHSSRKGVEEAAYLMERLNLKKDRKFVCVKIETSPVEAIAHDVDEESLELMSNLVKGIMEKNDDKSQ